MRIPETCKIIMSCLAIEEVNDSMESIRQLASYEWHNKNNFLLRRVLRTSKIFLQESVASVCEVPPIIIHRTLQLRRTQSN